MHGQVLTAPPQRATGRFGASSREDEQFSRSGRCPQAPQ
ncbi:hypothetical protein SFR_3987 [Streptomyces sp. FR-008]|nr:hypothetical protein SFR_3987 [Streptomyces sp. FR-008]